MSQYGGTQKGGPIPMTSPQFIVRAALSAFGGLMLGIMISLIVSLRLALISSKKDIDLVSFAYTLHFYSQVITTKFTQIHDY